MMKYQMRCGNIGEEKWRSGRGKCVENVAKSGVAGGMKIGNSSTAYKEKKGSGTDYRSVMLMSSLYKIYTTALAERLSKKTEIKGLVAESQAKFRRKMGAMDIRSELFNK